MVIPQVEQRNSRVLVLHIDFFLDLDSVYGFTICESVFVLFKRLEF